MADIESYEYLSKTKKKLKDTITFSLAVIILFFLLAFLPLKVFGYTGEISISDLVGILLRMTSSVLLSLLLRNPLFATDPLATGQSKASRYLKSLYPSKVVKEKYDVTYGEAEDLWFSFFNTWPRRSDYHLEWRTVLERTYNCRFIYYVQRLLFYASIVSGVLLISILLYSKIVENESALSNRLIIGINPYNLGYFIITSVLCFALKVTNRVPGTAEEQPSGCWLKYKEISEIEHSILKREILDKAQNYQDAMKLLEDRKNSTDDK